MTKRIKYFKYGYRLHVFWYCKKSEVFEQHKSLSKIIFSALR